MPSYHYIALSQDQKELSGVIEAPDEVAARKKLNDLGFSVISLNTTQAQTQAQTGKTTFEFEALDKNGKKVVGTIVSESSIKAYARLFDEYQLTVLSMVDTSADPGEKNRIRAAGVQALEQQYEQLYGKKTKLAAAEDKLQTQEKEQRTALLQKVDFTISSVDSFLQTYGSDLKIEERDTIRAYLNQLARIKDSTNLEHIRGTCERMLEHIQKQELFMHEEQKMKESMKMKIETKEMLSQLKRTGLNTEIDIVKSATSLQENRFFKPLATLILRLFRAQNPEINKLRDEIKAINRNIIAYLKILITGQTKAAKLEAWEGIKAIREEKKRLRLKIKAIKMEEQARDRPQKAESFFWEHIGNGTGWVLAFYIATYVIAYPFTIKQAPLPQLPKNFYFYQSGFTKTITILLFLAYAVITTRNYWLKKYSTAGYILYPLTLFGFLLIVINLM